MTVPEFRPEEATVIGRMTPRLVPSQTTLSFTVGLSGRTDFPLDAPRNDRISATVITMSFHRYSVEQRILGRYEVGGHDAYGMRVCRRYADDEGARAAYETLDPLPAELDAIVAPYREAARSVLRTADGALYQLATRGAPVGS